MNTIGFIGLGHMGLPMCSNLLKAGFAIQAFDVSPDALHQAGEKGARICGCAEEAVSGCDAVVTMLPGGKQVSALFLQEDSLLEAMSPGTLLLECSTIEADTARLLAQACQERGINCLDAPVSGGTAGAAAGTLTFMVGGEAEPLASAHSVLSAMGQQILHAGPSGAGQLAKACNNMLLAIQMAGTAEALHLGLNNGLDPAVLSEIMKVSSGNNWVLQKYNPCPGVMEAVPASKDYQGGFMVDLMLKDLGLAEAAAQASGSTTPLGSLARNLFRLHRGSDKGQLDFSSIYQLFDAKE